MPRKPYRKELGKPLTQRIPEKVVKDMEAMIPILGISKYSTYYEIIEALIKEVKAQKSHVKNSIKKG